MDDSAWTEQVQQCYCAGRLHVPCQGGRCRRGRRELIIFILCLFTLNSVHLQCIWLSVLLKLLFLHIIALLVLSCSINMETASTAGEARLSKLQRQSKWLQALKCMGVQRCAKVCNCQRINKRHLMKRYNIYMLIIVIGAESRSFFCVRVVYAHLKLVIGLIWHAHTNTSPLRNQFI